MLWVNFYFGLKKFKPVSFLFSFSNEATTKRNTNLTGLKFPNQEKNSPLNIYHVNVPVKSSHAYPLDVHLFIFQSSFEYRVCT